MNQNVCKFNLNNSSDLICDHLVYETSGAQSVPRIASRHGIYLAASGSGVLYCSGKQYSVSAGTLFFVAEGERFSVVSEDEFRYYYIHFHGRRGDEYLLRLGIGPGHCTFGGYESLIPFWEECSRSAVTGNIDLVCEAVLLYSLSKLQPDPRQHSSVVSSMVAAAQKRFAEHDFSLSRVSGELGYSEKYLSSVFKKSMGISYTQYLQQIRLKHAIFLMEEGVFSVKNVAILSGFRDPLYFSRVFSRSEGMSPKQYIQNITERRVKQQQLPK